MCKIQLLAGTPFIKLRVKMKYMDSLFAKKCEHTLSQLVMITGFTNGVAKTRPLDPRRDPMPESNPTRSQLCLHLLLKECSSYVEKSEPLPKSLVLKLKSRRRAGHISALQFTFFWWYKNLDKGLGRWIRRLILDDRFI